MRDPELVARARYAATRLEQAWERWRTVHGLAGSADPLASYVGYSLREPMGQPRVVIGVDAAEAERFADFLEHHQCGAQAQPGSLSVNGTARPAAGIAPVPRDIASELAGHTLDSAERATADGPSGAERTAAASAEQAGPGTAERAVRGGIERAGAEHARRGETERVAGERVAGERVAGERVAGERVTGERVAGERVAGERVAGERAERGRTERGGRRGGAGRALRGAAQRGAAERAVRNGTDPGGMDRDGMDRGGMDRDRMDRGGMDRGGMDRGGPEHGGAERAVAGNPGSHEAAVAHVFHQAPVAQPLPPMLPPGPPQDAPEVIAAELAGWGSGELPGQASEQLAAWAADAAAAGRKLPRLFRAFTALAQLRIRYRGQAVQCEGQALLP